MGQHDSELKAEQSLGAWENHPGFYQKLLNFDVERRVGSLVVLTERHSALPFAQKRPSQLRKAVPERESQSSGYRAPGNRAVIADNPLPADKEIDAQRQCEGKQGEVGNDCHELVQPSAVPTSFYNAVIRLWSDQQADGHDQKPERQSVEIADMCRKGVETLTERAA